MNRRLLWLNVATKALLVGLLLFSVTSDLARFNGKAMWARALAYPLAALIVPVGWRLRGRPQPYPHVIDILVVLPFVIDTGGNVFDLYSIWWFDDVAHFLNWWILVSAFALALRMTSLGRLPAWSIAVGFGAATEILWELGEYTVMKLGSSGLQLTYEDTIGDLALGGAGTLLGATIVAAGTVAAWPKSPPSPARTKSSARTARRRSRPS
jgi:hypothetical protein